VAPPVVQSQAEPVINGFANTCARQASCVKVEASSDCKRVTDPTRGLGDMCKVRQESTAFAGPGKGGT
jgi:hypothetical protein